MVGALRARSKVVYDEAGEVAKPRLCGFLKDI